MLTSLCSDLLVYGAEVTTIVHRDQQRLPVPGLNAFTSTDADDKFREMAATAGRTILIAPEIDGILLRLARVVVEAGGRLLGPSPTQIELFSDKYATNCQFGPLAINTHLWPELPDGDGPVVIKPRFGVGSMHTLIVVREHLNFAVAHIRDEGYLGELVTQPVWEGVAVSVAVVGSGAGRQVCLPTVLQHIETIGMADTVRQLEYRGGTIPAPDYMEQRAQRLVQHALKHHPDLRGYVGFDMILGPTEELDRICEVNPRLTTSYVGYREMFGASVAGLFLTDDPEAWSHETKSKRSISFTATSVDGGIV